MNYMRIYSELCVRAQSRDQVPGTIYESHHILPRSLGGGDEPANKCRLTIKEHYLAHLILAHAGGPACESQWASVEIILQDCLNPNKPRRYRQVRYHRWVRKKITLYRSKCARYRVQCIRVAG
jgi:hypothetical protein